MGWEWRRQDREAVLAALGRGEYEAVATSAQGAVDDLAHLAFELGVFSAAVEEIKIQRERRGIPDDLLLRTLVVLPFLDATSLWDASTVLFGDPAILSQLGDTAVQIRQGFNGRYRNAGGEKSPLALPVHPNVLRQEMARITPGSLDAFRQRCIRTLFHRRLIRGTTYAIDGTGLGKDWRVVALLTVTEGRTILVSWRLLHGTESEKGKEASVVRGMVDEVRSLAGPEVVRLLLMDAFYADGPLLARLKYEDGIDALVRIPEDRDIFTDMTQIVQPESCRWQKHPDVRYVAGHKQVRTVAVAAIEDLTTWDSFRETAAEDGEEDARLWGCLIHETPADGAMKETTWGLVSTRPFASGWKGDSTWRQRWDIENIAFRELKEGWRLEKARWGRSMAVVAARVTLTCMAFNVAQVMRGRDGRQLLNHGIRRLRRQLTREVGAAPVVVYTRDCYAVLNIEDIMTAVGRPPQESLCALIRHKQRLR